MNPDIKTAPTSGIVEAAVVSKAVRASNYQIRPEYSTINYAVAKVATRFSLRIETARLICTLSGIGGRR
ncbi:MAG: hypothetical protein KKB66_18405 [Alphaproteobacteria bacterium]|uniref:Uncharacterized protein n=1 Tax=viral metagenome TaxID=1070528 RepID=A0A6H1ZGS0_9ZZZZ|nr:hypothetical protein [Alphaproteobacteria bacterium]MBU0803576.1 hypothetical protein [Alphaproteobacteria bacterium]MBU0873127.1 hypothetical protein [Alphaproteobacteria bacterium]MBU1593145.1 hypothetical protein [Alphaproteobacteria bacterium]MBU1789014.1 hypothetical protein [Alphaproteobacteria bacterium]